MANKTISIFWGAIGVIIALIGGGLMWVYPEKKWMGWILIGLGVAAFLAFVGYLFVAANRKEDEQNLLTAQPQQGLPQGGIVIDNRPTYNYHPQLNQSQTVSQSQNHNQSQHQENKTTKAEHNLVALEPRIGYTEPIDTYHIKEFNYYKEGTTHRTAIAEFSNEVVQGLEVASLRSVKARLIYYDKEGGVYWRASAGWWIDHEYNTISFEPHEIRKLIIAALVDNEIGYTAFANLHDSYRDGYDRYESRMLEGDKFRVEVQLIAGGAMVGCFNYNLLLQPLFGVKLIKQDNESNEKGTLAEIIRQLSGLAEEGDHLLTESNQIVNTENAWSKAKEWAAKAEAHIKESVSDDSAAYFSLAVTKPYPGLAVDRSLVNFIYTRVQRIGEIVSDLRKR